MVSQRAGEIAVIFVSQSSGADESGYAEAAAAMGARAADQPGYRGIDSARGADGFGITVSYWADEASAIAWRNHPEHALIRDQGRALWYSRYELVVSEVRRDYRWSRD